MGWGVEHRLAAAVACAALLTLSAPVAATGAVPTADPAGCAVVAALVATGDLDDATTIAAALDGGKGPSPEVDADRACPEAIAQSRTRREAASNLVARAKTTADPTTKALLASAAHTLDGDNAEATALVGTAKTPAQPTLCAAAERATARGEFARAQAVYDALEDVEAAKKCREQGLVALTEAEQADPATVVTDSVGKDLLPTLLLLALSFAVGAWVSVWLRWRVRMRRTSLALAATAVLLGAVALVVLRSSPRTTHRLGEWWDAVTPWDGGWPTRGTATVLALVLTCALAALLGWVAANVQRDRMPVTIEVTGTSTEGFAARVVDEIGVLGADRSAGAFVPQGTDVANSGLTAALSAATSNALAKLVLTVWNLVRLRVSDTVRVVLTGEEGKPVSAVVALWSGQRVARTRAVDGHVFCLDATTPTADELASSARDVATAVAAVVLVERVTSQEAAKARLYGASDPMSLALCVVAARRLEDEEIAAARELYEAAIDLDRGNLTAQHGAAAARLRSYPGPREAAQLIRVLDRLDAKLKTLDHAPDRGDGSLLPVDPDVSRLPEPRKRKTPPSPLRWRLWWLRAAARANLQLAGDGTPTWAGLTTPSARRAFRAVDADLKRLEGLARRDVREADLALARHLVANARTARRGLRLLAGNGRPPLVASDVVVADRAVQFTAACGLAVEHAAAAADPRQVQAAEHLATACVDLVRAAGGRASWRATLLDDPFLELVADTDPLATLRAEWRPATKYDGVACFGKVTAVVAAAYPEPADLATALADPVRATALARRTRVAHPPLHEWAGAAAWLAREQKAAVITLYQAAGLPDAAAARALTKRAVKARLRGAMSLVGATELPDKATRAAMRRA